MIMHSLQAAMPSRYIWNAAVGGALVDARLNDPTGITNAAANKKRPAVGFIAGSAGALMYKDSLGQNCFIAQCNAGQFYPADISQVLLSGNVNTPDAGNVAVTTTAFKLTLFWEI